jgi:hypothetical protein
LLSLFSVFDVHAGAAANSMSRISRIDERIFFFIISFPLEVRADIFFVSISQTTAQINTFAKISAYGFFRDFG